MTLNKLSVPLEKKEATLKTLESLSLSDINELYAIQDKHFSDKVAEIDIDTYPFSHFEVEGLFHQDFFEYLEALMPNSFTMKKFKDLDGVPKDYPESRKAFFIKTSQTGHSLMYDQVSDDRLRYNYFRLYRWFEGVLCPQFMAMFNIDRAVKTHDEFVYMVDSSGFSLIPHTDIKQKTMSVLLYMNDVGDKYGTNILVPKFDHTKKHSSKEKDYTIVKTSKFKKNNLLSFKRSEDSFHSVSEFDQDGERRFLLFTAISA
jgi:hypothetical protein